MTSACSGPRSGGPRSSSPAARLAPTAAPAQPTPPGASSTASRVSSSTTSTTEAVAADPRALAVQVARTETAIRDLATPGSVLAGLGRTEMLAYRQLATHPAWVAPVLAQTPPGLRAAVAANVDAAVELAALVPPATKAPSWEVRPPAPADQLLGYYREAEAASGVPWYYLAAVHLVETGMGRIRSPSTAGAQGPMQIMADEWAAHGQGDIHSDHDAILAAGRILRAYGAPDMAKALYRYNPSRHYVRAVTDYAEVMHADERAYRGYYNWPVLVRLVTGDVVLPEAPS